MKILESIRMFLLLLFTTLSFFACNSNSSKKVETTLIGSQLDSNTLSTQKNAMRKENIKAENILKKDRIFTYFDSVELYASPFDTSKIVGYLDSAYSLERLQLFADHRGKILDWPGGGWLGAMYKDDTVWLKKGLEITTKFDVDSIQDIVLYNYYLYCDFGGFGCYNGTRVENLRLKKTIYNRTYFDLEKVKGLTDSLIHFPILGKTIIYDTYNDTIIYTSRAKRIAFSKKYNQIYFLKHKNENNTDTIILYKYNYKNFIEKALYQEPTDSTDLCIYFDDGGICPEIEITYNDTIEYLKFTLFQIKENPIDESDVYTYNIQVDSKGRLYNRIKTSNAP